jgi:predicted alpha/beta hydrolase
LRSWCFDSDFFIPWFENKGVASHYHEVTNSLTAYHLADDAIAPGKSCRYIFDMYSNANRKFETLDAKNFGMKKFGHRGFFHPAAEKKLWPYFLEDLEK